MALITIPLDDYPVGVRNFGSGFQVAAGVSLIVVSFSLAPDWIDPARRIVSRWELSLDDGATWSPVPDGRLEWPWGIFPFRFGIQGNPNRSAGGVRCAVPDPANPDRRVRGNAEVIGGVVRTAVTVEMT